MSLNDKTPAESAGIKFPFRNWKDVVEQPYQTTSRIKIVTTPKASLPKVYKPRLSQRIPRITAKTPRLVTQHYSKRGDGLTRRSDI